MLARGQHWLGPTLSGGDFARGDIVWGRHCQGATLFQPGASRVGDDFVGDELVKWRDDQHLKIYVLLYKHVFCEWSSAYSCFIL